MDMIPHGSVWTWAGSQMTRLAPVFAGSASRAVPVFELHNFDWVSGGLASPCWTFSLLLSCVWLLLLPCSFPARAPSSSSRPQPGFHHRPWGTLTACTTGFQAVPEVKISPYWDHEANRPKQENNVEVFVFTFQVLKLLRQWGLS